MLKFAHSGYDTVVDLYNATVFGFHGRKYDQYWLFCTACELLASVGLLRVCEFLRFFFEPCEGSLPSCLSPACPRGAIFSALMMELIVLLQRNCFALKAIAQGDIGATILP